MSQFAIVVNSIGGVLLRFPEESLSGLSKMMINFAQNQLINSFQTVLQQNVQKKE